MLAAPGLFQPALSSESTEPSESVITASLPRVVHFLFCHFSVLCSAGFVFSQFLSNTQDLFRVLPFQLAVGGAVFF